MKSELKVVIETPKDIENVPQIKSISTFLVKWMIKSRLHSEIRFVLRYWCLNHAYKAIKSEMNKVNIELNLVA